MKIVVGELYRDLTDGEIVRVISNHPDDTGRYDIDIVRFSFGHAPLRRKLPARRDLSRPEWKKLSKLERIVTDV